MIRMTWQYFFMAAKSFSSCFLPSSSCHFLQYLVKAFFLDLYLWWNELRGRGRERHTKRLAHTLHEPTAGPAEVSVARAGRLSSGLAREGQPQLQGSFWLLARFLRSPFHRPEEPGAHRGMGHPSGAAPGVTDNVRLAVYNTRGCHTGQQHHAPYIYNYCFVTSASVIFKTNGQGSHQFL